jgi:hypothetical protein
MQVTLTITFKLPIIFNIQVNNLSGRTFDETCNLSHKIKWVIRT